MTALQASPWISIEARYSVGDLVEGAITSIQPFGIFIELAAGVEGLLHQSEFSSNCLISHGEYPQPGEKLLVRITSIQPTQQRIGLSLQQVFMEEQLTCLRHKDNVGNRENSKEERL